MRRMSTRRLSGVSNIELHTTFSRQRTYTETLEQQDKWQKDFNLALEEIGKPDEEEDNSFGGRWLCSLGLAKENFSPEMEARWLQWFHDTTICKKLAERL